MIADLKPYSQYRNAEAGWIGQIPTQWQVRRMKYLLRELDARSKEGKEQLLKVSQYTGVTRRLSDDNGEEPDTRADSLVGYKRVEPSDLAINIMLAWNGSLGVSRYSGIVSPAYCVYRLRSQSYRSLIKVSSRGVIECRLRLFSEDLYRLEGLIPAPEEQTAIVRFLNFANGQIDQAIRKKRKVIALLSEQKQAIIYRAITRGLDPSVPLKQSGISWLGDIPRHWTIVRNLALFSHRVEAGVPGLPVLQVSLRTGITAEELDQFGRPKRLIADHTKYKLICSQDLAYNTMRMWQGAVGVSSFDGLVSPAYVVISPRKDVCSRFYEFIFRTSAYKQQVNRYSTGIVSDRNRLYWESFKQMPNWHLPRDEQESIWRYIEDQTRTPNITIGRLQREIELLREYQARLGDDVVAGKLDVRKVAAELPDEVVSEDALLPADDLIDDKIAEAEVAA
jgi:type I restriction enzyme S subunit